MYVFMVDLNKHNALYLMLQIFAQKIQKDLQQQQSNFDSTQETLNSLCRKYPSVELETLGGTVTSLIKKYEAVNQLCLKTQTSMQESLEKHFFRESSWLLICEPQECMKLLEMNHASFGWWNVSINITNSFLCIAFPKTQVAKNLFYLPFQVAGFLHKLS